ncbi:MAG: hypothetical protein ACYDCJ_00895 [Gammaproteobacteria bacterium]
MKIEQRIEALEIKLRPAPRPTFAVVYRDDHGQPCDRRGSPLADPLPPDGRVFTIVEIPLNGRE